MCAMRSFGERAKGERLERMQDSPLWVDGGFRNLHLGPVNAVQAHEWLGGATLLTLASQRNLPLLMPRLGETANAPATDPTEAQPGLPWPLD